MGKKITKQDFIDALNSSDIDLKKAAFQKAVHRALSYTSPLLNLNQLHKIDADMCAVEIGRAAHHLISPPLDGRFFAFIDSLEIDERAMVLAECIENAKEKRLFINYLPELEKLQEKALYRVVESLSSSAKDCPDCLDVLMDSKASFQWCWSGLYESCKANPNLVEKAVNLIKTKARCFDGDLPYRDMICVDTCHDLSKIETVAFNCNKDLCYNAALELTNKGSKRDPGFFNFMLIRLKPSWRWRMLHDVVSAAEIPKYVEMMMLQQNWLDDECVPAINLLIKKADISYARSFTNMLALAVQTVREERESLYPADMFGGFLVGGNYRNYPPALKKLIKDTLLIFGKNQHFFGAVEELLLDVMKILALEKTAPQKEWQELVKSLASRMMEDEIAVGQHAGSIAKYMHIVPDFVCEEVKSAVAVLAVKYAESEYCVEELHKLTKACDIADIDLPNGFLATLKRAKQKASGERKDKARTERLKQIFCEN